MNENVNHPNHYNIPGRKECIVEMVEKFGTEAVETFCKLNSYKYRYRHELKNGQEDLDKAAWYDDFASLMHKNNDKAKIANTFGLQAQQNQLVEEMAELTQAICKLNRVTVLGQPLPMVRKEAEVIKDNMIEELADVRLVLDQVVYLLGCEQVVDEIIQYKIQRTMERMVKK